VVMGLILLADGENVRNDDSKKPATNTSVMRVNEWDAVPVDEVRDSDSVIERVKDAICLAGVKGAFNKRLHLAAALNSIGYDQEMIRRKMNLTAVQIKKVISSHRYQEAVSYYTSLLNSSTDIGRKLLSLMVPKAVSKLADSLNSEFPSISNKGATELLKSAGLTSQDDSQSRPVIYISSDKLMILNQVEKLIKEYEQEKKQVQITGQVQNTSTDSDEQ